MQYIDEVDIQNFKKIDTSSWDTLKDNVFLRLINKKYLDKYGKGIAHVNCMDLAMVFSIQEKVKNTIVSHILTEKELNDFGVDINEAREVAHHNTSNDRKRRIMTFKENTLKNNTMYPVLKIPTGMMMGAGGRSMSECGIIQDTDDEKECDNILILCNKHDTFGSSYMIIPEVLDEVYSRFNEENFYIVPMSIHQVMCIRAGYVSDDGKKPRYEVEDDLFDMVESLNDQHKSWKDVLSYKVYYYFGDDGKRLFLIK